MSKPKFNRPWNNRKEHQTSTKFTLQQLQIDTKQTPRQLQINTRLQHNPKQTLKETLKKI